MAECKLTKDLKGCRSLVLTALNEVLLPDNVIVNGEIKNPPIIVEAIKKCTKTVKGSILSTRAVIASLPETQCYFKVIRAPKVAEANISDFISKAVHQQFPLEKGKVYFDWKYIDQTRIAIGAASKNIVDSYTGVIEQADLIPLSLEMESAAIARALTTSKEMAQTKYKILMDLGASHSSIIVVEKNSPIFTLKMPLSGNHFTQQIARALKLTFEKAEETKLKCGLNLAKCPPNIKKIIFSLIASSIKEIGTSMQYIHRFLKRKPDRIYISGGVSQMAKLSNILSEELKIKIRHANPLANIKLSKKLKITDKELLGYATVIGLAIKGVENNNQK